jgi:transposase
MARYKNPKRTQKYTAEFKIQAVQMSYYEGREAKEIAEALGIHPVMLYRWRKEYREGIIVPDRRRKLPVKKKHEDKAPSGEENAKRISELEKKVVELEKENELLKKWQRFLAEQRKKNSDS